LALVLVLGACGGGGGTAAPTGTYVWEDGTPGTFTFTGDSFVASIPLSELELDDMPGDFSIRGDFSVDAGAETISFTIDEDALREDALQLIQDVFEQDPELGALMEDPEFAEIVEALKDNAFEFVLSTLLEEIGSVELRFEGDFDRLIDPDGSILVRQ